jgi:thermitase
MLMKIKNNLFRRYLDSRMLRINNVPSLHLMVILSTVLVSVWMMPTIARADAIKTAEFKDRRPALAKLKDTFSSDLKEDSIIVKLKDESSNGETLSALDASLVDDNDDGRTVVIRPKGLESAQELLERAKQNINIEYAEPNNKLKASYIPNDSQYSQQWYIPKIKANQAWDLKPGGNGVIAVIDTGADYTHPDLSSNLSGGYDFVNGDNNPADDNGHGTFVAGVISAVINNNQGVAGISKNAPIMPLKALDASGEGYESDIALAIKYAADNGAKIINLSLGGDSQSQLLQDAVTYADGLGSIVVAASGNGGASSLSYPAGYPVVVAVGSTGQTDQKSNFSNWGSNLDLVAPGENIVSTYIGGGYAVSSGTSASTPVVSAALSLIMSGGQISKTEALNRLKTTNDKVGGVIYDAGGYNTQYGYGRINTLNLINNTVTSTPAPPLSLSPVYRFWSSAYSHHFYTSSLAERNHVMATWPNVWSYEGIAYYVAQLNGGNCPNGLNKVYRFWSDSFRGHFYTASEYEKNYVMATWPNVWSYEGAQYCVSASNTNQFNSQVYRFWSSSFNGHFYTSSLAERNHVIATWPNVWSYEGGVFWVGSAP